MSGIALVLAIIGGIGGVVTLLGVVVGLTRYFVQREEKRKLEIETEGRKKIEERLEVAERQRDQLRQEIAVAGQAGSVVLHIKAKLDEELRQLMDKIGASGGSIYAPAQASDGKATGLYFISIEPFNPQTEQLKKKIIPLKSMAGRCLQDGSYRVPSAGRQQVDHFQQAERISHYRPATTLNIALRHDSRIIGVLQLLRHEGEEGFLETDLKRATSLSEKVEKHLYELVTTGNFVKVLGLGDTAEGVNGTVLIFDITRSSLLFREFDPSMALKLLNEYFDSLCDVAFANGAVLDNYMGDGALLRFNVAKPQPDHELAAVKAAVDMGRAFEELQSYWTQLNSELDKLHFRAGIASGELVWGNLGHTQSQRLTIVGEPISVAATLCNEADRTQSVILVSEEIHDAVKGRVDSLPCDLAKLGKAKDFTNAVYRIKGLR